MLHGVGSHEGDLFGLADMFDPRFQVVSLRAPLSLGPGSYGWFRVVFTAEGPMHDPEAAEASRQLLLEALPAAVEQYGADPDRTYLLGFSQGAIMSSSVALTEPEMVAGLVAMSGRILPEIRERHAASARLTGLPYMWVHGTADSVLPISHGRAARDFLQTLPVDLTYREYPMAHHTSPASLRDIGVWLTARLDAEQRTG